VIGVVATCALIAVGSLGGSGGKHQALYTTMSPEEMQFVHYLVAHGKSYGTRKEYEFRLGQFRESLGKIHEHNSRNDVTFRLGLNKFSDMTQDEYRRLLGLIHRRRDTQNV
jgi:hypothetical protein